MKHQVPKRIPLLRKIRIELRRLYVHTARLLRGFPTQHNTAITESIFVGGQFRPSKIKSFISWGVTGVVNMRSKPPTYQKKMAEHDISFLHLPVVDNTAPTIEQLKKGVDFISQHVNAGGKCYIHCRMGEGRGPTMGSAYLISEGFTLKEAIDAILLKRPFLKITPPQKKQLQKFAEQF